MSDAKDGPGYWASQSPVTDPGGPGAKAIDELPGELGALREASSQLVFHYRAGGDFAANGVPAERASEINTSVLDEVSARTADPGVAPDDITALAQRDGLRVPPAITRFDPYGGPPEQVDVSRAVGG